MTTLCTCKFYPILALPLEHDGRFYCGSCGGLFEGQRAIVAKNLWTTTGRINDEAMGFDVTITRRIVSAPFRRERLTRKGRKTRAKKGRGRD